MMYYLLAFITDYPTASLILLGLCALLIGSFLNVVIYRMPLILARSWHEACRADFDIIPEPSIKKINLCFPRSFCPQCHQLIPAWHNIPVFSFIFLKSRASCCNNPISWQYPVVELTSLLLSIFAAVYFGFSLTLLAALVFIWSMICLTVIDLKHQILPDTLTLGLLWIGLLLNTQALFTSLPSAVFGAVWGYAILWLVMKGFYLVTGKIGMGHGDFKLLAALGAWFGWAALPLILFTASILGAITGLIYLKLSQQSKNTPIPFGPFLCFSGLIALFWRDELLAIYVHAFF